MPDGPVPQTTPTAPREDPRRALGRHGEEIALTHLRALGFKLIARNHRTRHGELDLIVYDGHTLVFVEVKTRRATTRLPPRTADGESHGAITPLEGLRARQLLGLRRLAAAWLAETSERPRAGELRFDVVGVVIGPHDELLRLDHLEGVL